MRALLNTDFWNGCIRKKCRLQFLMPAAEAIYRPYDFRYIYDQCMQEVKKMRQQMIEIVKVSRRKKERLNFQMRIVGRRRDGRFFGGTFFGFVASICSARYSLLSDDDIGAASVKGRG